MSRIYNFSAGPSMLPLEVLEQAASEMTDYNGSGMSVMEMSHRSPVYDAIIKQTEADFRTLMNIAGRCFHPVCRRSAQPDENRQG